MGHLKETKMSKWEWKITRLFVSTYLMEKIEGFLIYTLKLRNMYILDHISDNSYCKSLASCPLLLKHPTFRSIYY